MSFPSGQNFTCGVTISYWRIKCLLCNYMGEDAWKHVRGFPWTWHPHLCCILLCTLYYNESEPWGGLYAESSEYSKQSLNLEVVLRLLTQLVSEVGFTSTTVTHWNTVRALSSKRKKWWDDAVLPFGGLWNHPWYETAAELLSVWREKSYLGNLKMTDLTPAELAHSIPWLPLAMLSKVGGETAQLGWHLWFLFLPPRGKRKGPELSFGWTKNVKCWCWFLLRP